MRRIRAMSRFRLACAAACALLGFGLAGEGAIRSVNANDEPGPAIFKWVDQHGIAHYTTDKTRIPREIRRRMRSLDAIPDVAAAPPAPAADPNLVGPLPETPEHPEGWASRNAPPTPTPGESEKIEAAERSEQLDAMDAEIAGLEGEIANREEQLLALLATAQGDRVIDDAAFRQIAEELPELQADLEALRERRGELATAP